MADTVATSKERGLRWSVITAAVGLIVIPTIVLIFAHRYLSFSHKYSRLTQQISEQSSLNLYLIKAAAAVLALLLVFGAKFLFSLSAKRRKIGIALIALSTVLYNLGLYGLTRNANFSLGGAALKYCAVTPKGLRCYDRPGIDEEFGIRLEAATPEKVRYWNELVGSPLQLVDPAHAEWFNAFTGDPELWYSQLSDGTLRFFNKPGFDPATGATLQPVTREFHEHWQALRNAAEADEQRRREAASRSAAAEQRADRVEAQLAEQQRADLAAAQQAEATEKTRRAAEKLQTALPSWRAADARLKGELTFWDKMRRELSTSGSTLRPEIESALQVAQSTASDCEHSYSIGDGDALRACTITLNTVLDKIASFKN